MKRKRPRYFSNRYVRTGKKWRSGSPTFRPSYRNSRHKGVNPRRSAVRCTMQKLRLEVGASCAVSTAVRGRSLRNWALKGPLSSIGLYTETTTRRTYERWSIWYRESGARRDGTTWVVSDLGEPTADFFTRWTQKRRRRSSSAAGSGRSAGIFFDAGGFGYRSIAGKRYGYRRVGRTNVPVDWRWAEALEEWLGEEAYRLQYLPIWIMWLDGGRWVLGPAQAAEVALGGASPCLYRLTERLEGWCPPEVADEILGSLPSERETHPLRRVRVVDDLPVHALEFCVDGDDLRLYLGHLGAGEVTWQAGPWRGAVVSYRLLGQRRPALLHSWRRVGEASYDLAMLIHVLGGIGHVAHYVAVRVAYELVVSERLRLQVVDGEGGVHELEGHERLANLVEEALEPWQPTPSGVPYDWEEYVRHGEILVERCLRALEPQRVQAREHPIWDPRLSGALAALGPDARRFREGARVLAEPLHLLDYARDDRGGACVRRGPVKQYAPKSYYILPNSPELARAWTN